MSANSAIDIVFNTPPSQNDGSLTNTEHDYEENSCDGQRSNSLNISDDIFSRSQSRANFESCFRIDNSETTESPISRVRQSLVIINPNTVTTTTAPRATNILAKEIWNNGSSFNPIVEQFEVPLTTINPQFGTSVNSTPFQIVKCFLQDSLQTIIQETNNYSGILKQKSPNILKNWKPLTESEFWKLMALSSLMGLVRKSEIEEYWSTNELIQTPIFSKTIPRNRYLDILRCLHFASNEQPAELLQNRFYKLGTFLPKVIEKFNTCINAEEYLCVDESLMPFKGRLSFNQYVPSKRSRFGIKFFALVDCQSKIVLKLLPYQGKGTININQEIGIGGSVVEKLLADKYMDKFHKVVADNWFFSPALASRLLKTKTYYLGTVQKRRLGSLQIQMKAKLKKGECQSFNRKGILVERWRDRREVFLLNTFQSHNMKFIDSKNPLNARMKPETVAIYNSQMGGVDHVDKVLTPYQSIRKARKWYKKAFFHIWDLVVYNSFYIYKLHHPNTKRRIKEFIKTLIREILDTYPAVKTTRVHDAPSVCRLTGSHLQEQVFNSRTKRNFKNRCYYCYLLGTNKTSSYRCSKCKKWLCIRGEKSCFTRFHTIPRLPRRTCVVQKPEENEVSTPSSSSSQLSVDFFLSSY